MASQEQSEINHGGFNMDYSPIEESAVFDGVIKIDENGNLTLDKDTGKGRLEQLCSSLNPEEKILYIAEFKSSISNGEISVQYNSEFERYTLSANLSIDKKSLKKTKLDDVQYRKNLFSAMQNAGIGVEMLDGHIIDMGSGSLICPYQGDITYMTNLYFEISRELLEEEIELITAVMNLGQKVAIEMITGESDAKAIDSQPDMPTSTKARRASQYRSLFRDETNTEVYQNLIKLAYILRRKADKDLKEKNKHLS